MRIMKAIAAFILATAAAAAPAQETGIVYQGRVETIDGTGCGGTFEMTFRIYDQEGAKTPLWTMTAPVETDANGSFQVVFSDAGTIDEDSGAARTIQDLVNDGKANYLGISIEDCTELSPRQSILPQPRTEQADYAYGLAKNGSADKMTVETIDCGEFSSSYGVKVTERIAGGADSRNMLNEIYLPSGEFQTLSLSADKGMDVFSKDRFYGWMSICTRGRENFRGCENGVIFLTTLNMLEGPDLQNVTANMYGGYNVFARDVAEAWRAPGLVFFNGAKDRIADEEMLIELYTAVGQTSMRSVEIHNRQFKRDE